MEDIENIEDIDTFENFEGIDEIEVEEADDIEEMEGSETIKSIKKMVFKLENHKSSLKSQKNGKTFSCNAITLPREFMATTGYKGKKMLEGQYPLISRK